MNRTKPTGSISGIRLLGALLLFVPFILPYAFPDHLLMLVSPLARAPSPTRAPLTLADGRLVFPQSDMSLTALDLNTGRVIFRGVPLEHEAEGHTQESQRTVRVFGRLAVATGYVVDMETGALLARRARHGEIAGNHYIFDGVVDGKQGIQVADIVTGALRTLAGPGWFAATATEDRLFVVDNPGKSGTPTLWCLDAVTGEILWTREVPATKEIPHAYENSVYLLPDLWTSRAMETALPAFSTTGEALPAVEPEARLYGAVLDDYLKKRQDGGPPAALPSLENWLRFKNRFLKHQTPLHAAILGKNVEAGVYREQVAGDADRWRTGRNETVPDNFILYFADSDRKWERRINCLDYNFPSELSQRFIPTLPREDLIGSVSFAATDRFLVYSTGTGKVECIDRTDGRSRWLYSFPRRTLREWAVEHPPNAPFLFAPGWWSRIPLFSIANWWSDARFAELGFQEPTPPYPERILWGFENGRNYFVDDKRLFDDDMSLKGMLGVSAEGDSGRSHPPMNFDPKAPDLEFPENRVVEIICRYMPLAGLFAIWLMFAGYGGTARRFMNAVFLFLVIAAAFYCFGRYSYAAYLGMIFAIFWAYLAIAVTLIRHNTK